MNGAQAIPLRFLGRQPLRGRPSRARTAPRRAIVVRTAAAEDVAAIHALIADHLAEGHLLPRELGDVQRHVHRFVVALIGGRVIGCAELAPLSQTVAEVRSLVVQRAARSGSVGRRLVDELVRRAHGNGYATLCAFTHAPAYFVRLGFSLVPHISLPEKIAADCRSCPQFRRCGQYAVVRTFGAPRSAGAPQALHA